MGLLVRQHLLPTLGVEEGDLAGLVSGDDVLGERGEGGDCRFGTDRVELGDRLNGFCTAEKVICE